jgi:hypothetical protein
MIIALNGNSKCGKDTFYEAVKMHADRYAFADELKLMCLELFGLPLEKYEDAAYARWQRDIWIKFGDVAREATNGTFWAQKVIDKIKSSESLAPKVITDCGFYNEAEMLIENFGRDNVKIITIVRPDKEDANDGRTVFSTKFSDLTIMNDCYSVAEFKSKCIDVYKAVVNGRLSSNLKLV